MKIIINGWNHPWEYVHHQILSFVSSASNCQSQLNSQAYSKYVSLKLSFICIKKCQKQIMLFISFIFRINLIFPFFMINLTSVQSYDHTYQSLLLIIWNNRSLLNLLDTFRSCRIIKNFPFLIITFLFGKLNQILLFNLSFQSLLKTFVL